jgi:16S rRNA (guanine527-N7)-methyltransferase
MATAVPSVPSAEVIRRALRDFKAVVNEQQVAQVQQYMKLLLAWNDKVNLTAIHDPLEILYRHFCESMFGAIAAGIDNCRLADVGSGGGFPGLPMKILRPSLQVFLVESDVKKATFIAEVIRDIGLTGASVLVSRYQEVGEEVAPLDTVCSRAVGEFGPFLEWAASERIAARRAVLWIGGRDMEEVRKITGWNWDPPIAVPQSLRRFVLVGTRVEDAEGEGEVAEEEAA